MPEKYQTNQNCRICKGKRLILFFDLNEQPLANSFLRYQDLSKPEDKFPLKVYFCRDCNLVQLVDVVDPEVLFRNYVYFSSGMPVLPQHFKSYASEVYEKFITSKDDLVVEIGSNDGLLLNAIKVLGPKVLGVDPAVNIARVANGRGVETIPEFFGERLAQTIVSKYGRAKVIIGNNVVAHINDHHDLVKGLNRLLSKDGVFIFEVPYLIDMFENYSFDTIYHEHLSYLSVRPLVKLFEKYNMQIFDVKTFPVQGNSLRVYVGKKKVHSVFKSVKEFLKKEKTLKLDSLRSYIKLARKITEVKENVLSLLRKIKADGKKIAAYGAPAKGNTLLNFYGIGSEILEFATEALKSKIGLYTPGMHIPVVDISEARKNPPDYYLMLAWNYKDVILEKEKDFRLKGGKFIIPIGNMEII